jgi:hypothetical protein
MSKLLLLDNSIIIGTSLLSGAITGSCIMFSILLGTNMIKTESIARFIYKINLSNFGCKCGLIIGGLTGIISIIKNINKKYIGAKIGCLMGLVINIIKYKLLLKFCKHIYNVIPTSLFIILVFSLIGGISESLSNTIIMPRT